MTIHICHHFTVGAINPAGSHHGCGSAPATASPCHEHVSGGALDLRPGHGGQCGEDIGELSVDFPRQSSAMVLATGAERSEWVLLEAYVGTMRLGYPRY
jgi:hypothetical protein